MPPIAEAFAKSAENLVGTPFKLHGRSAQHGVDCVGLVELALQAAGREALPVPPYSLRNSSYDFVPNFAASNGFSRAADPVLRGDLLVVKPGPAQRHLLVAASPNRFIHAHAGLRRVVLMPGPFDWPIIHHFRLKEEA